MSPNFTSSMNALAPLQFVPALTIGWSGAIIAPRFMPLTSGPAAVEILANDAADSDAVTALDAWGNYDPGFTGMQLGDSRGQRSRLFTWRP